MVYDNIHQEVKILAGLIESWPHGFALCDAPKFSVFRAIFSSSVSRF
jgi:hypothetical protein